MEYLIKFFMTTRGTMILVVIIILIASITVWTIKNDRSLAIGPVEIGNKPALPAKDTSQVINGDQFGTVNGDVIKDHGVKNSFCIKKIPQEHRNNEEQIFSYYIHDRCFCHSGFYSLSMRDIANLFMSR